jgi:hypothetical protein
VLTVTIVLIPLKSYDFQKAYLTLYYGADGGIAAFLIVQTANLRLTEVKLSLDRTEPQFKAAILKKLKIVLVCFWVSCFNPACITLLLLKLLHKYVAWSPNAGIAHHK